MKAVLLHYTKPNCWFGSDFLLSYRRNEGWKVTRDENHSLKKNLAKVLSCEKSFVLSVGCGECSNVELRQCHMLQERPIDIIRDSNPRWARPLSCCTRP